MVVDTRSEVLKLAKVFAYLHAGKAVVAIQLMGQDGLSTSTMLVSESGQSML